MAYCRRLQAGRPGAEGHAGGWHWFSDQFHEAVTDAEVAAAEPYMLFYRLRLPPPPPPAGTALPQT